MQQKGVNFLALNAAANSVDGMETNFLRSPSKKNGASQNINFHKVTRLS